MREKTTENWITPQWLIQSLGPFDLDPCECDPQPWPCAAQGYRVVDNGLMLPWKGLVWLAPPAGRSEDEFLDKMVLHGSGIALISARVETRRFFKYVWPVANSVLFPKGRLTFYQPSGKRHHRNNNCQGASALVAYGSLAAMRLRNCASIGKLIELRGS